MHKAATLFYAITISVTTTLLIALASDNVILWSALSLLGEEAAYILAATALYFLWSPQVGLRGFTALTLSGALNVFLKYALDLPRPPEYLWRVPASGPGFPSGHVQITATFWTIIVAHAKGPWRPAATLATFSTVLAVSLSRLHLQVHYPRDIVGGLLLGISVALAVISVGKAARDGAGSTEFVAMASAALSLLNLALGYDIKSSAALLGFSAALLSASYQLKRAGTYIDGLNSSKRATIMIPTTMLMAVINAAAYKLINYGKGLALAVILHAIALYCIVLVPYVHTKLSRLLKKLRGTHILVNEGRKT